MSIFSKLGSALFGLLGSAVLGGGTKKQIKAKPVTRDTAREEADRDDDLRRRRGSRANMITGVAGAELPGASAGRLITGS